MPQTTGSAPLDDPALVTGEAVPLELRLAALPSRMLAGVLDLGLQLALFVGIALLAEVSSVGLSEAAGAALGVVTVVLVLAVYHVAFETLLRGRTPGKAAMGLRAVRDDGGPISFRHALVRGLSAAVLEKPGLTLGALPVFVLLLTRRSQRLGDLLAGTVVVRERVPGRAHEAVAMPEPLAAWARTLELSRLPDGLALSVRQFLARAPQLGEAAREHLGEQLVSAVSACTAPPPPPGTPGWAYLSAVLAERRRRETERLSAHGSAPEEPFTAPAAAPPGRTSPQVAAAPGGYAPLDGSPPPARSSAPAHEDTPQPAPAPAPSPAPSRSGFTLPS